jgi:hypothetical protein
MPYSGLLCPLFPTSSTSTISTLDPALSSGSFDRRKIRRMSLCFSSFEVVLVVMVLPRILLLLLLMLSLLPPPLLLLLLLPLLPLILFLLMLQKKEKRRRVGEGRC